MNIQSFWEEVKLSGQPVLQNCYAYRMDGDPHIGTMVHLGTCKCCDYFVICEPDRVLFIEDGQLGYRIKYLRNKYNFRKRDDRDDFVQEEIIEEHLLKAYGSLLILCRLNLLHQTEKALLQGKNNYEFWVVSTDTNQPGYAYLFDRIKTRLIKRLKNIFPSQLMCKVKVLNFQQFKARCPDLGS